MNAHVVVNWHAREQKAKRAWEESEGGRAFLSSGALTSASVGFMNGASARRLSPSRICSQAKDYRIAPYYPVVSTTS